jgi:hypothetical protein
MTTNATTELENFVTVRNGELSALLLGPYETHEEALGNVDRG